jgi:hypothetical protein
MGLDPIADLARSHRTISSWKGLESAWSKWPSFCISQSGKLRMPSFFSFALISLTETHDPMTSAKQLDQGVHWIEQAGLKNPTGHPSDRESSQYRLDQPRMMSAGSKDRFLDGEGIRICDSTT